MSRGRFSTWQPQYADIGLPTFPVEGKRPSIRGYLRVGLAASRKLAEKFADANSFGIALGRRTRIVIVDIDTADERALHQALERFGQTPFVVRSGSGHFQAWYRHNGEPRMIRPFVDLPIDILGAGFVVAPPSLSSNGEYGFLRGSLKDLTSLPALTSPLTGISRSKQVRIETGERNDALWRHAMRHARHVDDQSTLLDVVQNENEIACAAPLDAAEIKKITRSAWRYQIEGRNFIGDGGVYATKTELEDLGSHHPDALALLLILRSVHKFRDQFALGKAMAHKLGWTVRRFRAARAHLEHLSQIRCLHRGGRGKNDPPIYSLLEVRTRASI